MKVERSYRWLFWALALVGLAIDQGSKYFIFSRLYNHGHGGQIVLVDNLFSLVADYPHPTNPDAGNDLLTPLRTVSGTVMPAVNEGALWGRKLGLDGTMANNVFAVVSLIAALAIACWSVLPRSGRDRWLCLALGLIFAGAVGNLYDRIVFSGVRDFLRFHPFDFPIFNIADSCLVCGAAVLMLHALLVQPAQDKAPQPAVKAATVALAPAQQSAPEAAITK
jgi:signal peptidase II